MLNWIKNLDIFQIGILSVVTFTMFILYYAMQVQKPRQDAFYEACVSNNGYVIKTRYEWHCIDKNAIIKIEVKE